MDGSPDSFTFTVGKLDAGMAILLGERAHLIEFPSVLLPPGATTGSIVNIAVHQNLAEEKRREEEFWSLQSLILEEYGRNIPESPKLELRNVTQTSVTLEWPPIQLATSKLRSLDIYRNAQRLAAIPSPLTNTSTKLSGLEINTEYSFQLILRTTAGTYSSNVIRVRTHMMTDTSGVCVCFGNVQDVLLLENAKIALREMRAKWSDKIQIDTTHFVCTTPAAVQTGSQSSGGAGGAPGVEYQRALQLSIPVVQPQWILACHSEKRMVPIASYYLGSNLPPVADSQSFTRPQSMSQPPSQNSASGPTSYRSSMPPPSRSTAISPPVASAFINQPHSPETRNQSTRFEPTLEETPEDDTGHVESDKTTRSSKRTSRNGVMNKDFKFPPSGSSDGVARKAQPPPPLAPESLVSGVDLGKPNIVTPSNVDVPPPPVSKENRHSIDDVDEDVGPTVEISLN